MQRKQLERLLERTNNPILFLAIVAILLYILELFRVIPASLMNVFLWVNFLIDFIFFLDLSAKCTVLGRSYIRSPWFFIDLLSTLPIVSSAFEIMGTIGPQLQAARVARGARVARIARITRVARLAKVGRVARLATAIRAKQGLSFLKIDDKGEKTPRFNRALFIGVPLLLFGFIIASYFITNSSVEKLKSNINQEIAIASSMDELESIKRKYDVEKTLNPLLENIILYSDLNGGQEVPVSLEEAYASSDRTTGIMLLVVLLTIGLSVFISNSLSRDRSIRREQLILRQCFSPPIVDKFYNSPEVVDRFYRQWMTVFFIDIRGFTSAVEKDSRDVEGLALKLRKVMDVARQQIVVSHEGIIDKFMGDAVMGWVGGHFSVHWNLMKTARQNLFIDELDSADQDINSIKREIEKNKRLPKDQQSQLSHLELAIAEAEARKSELLQLQKYKMEKDPELYAQHQDVITEYRTRVAKSAVHCCLRICEEVEKIEEPDAFNKLKIGIGSGKVLIGNFGATDQIAYTVLGPTVNRAARLEPASAQAGCNILIDQNTYDLLKDDKTLRFRRLPNIEVKGISDVMATYEPFFANKVSDIFLSVFSNAVEAMEAGKNKEAMAYFDKANRLHPGGDLSSLVWLEICKKALELGQTVGVTPMKK